jgi:hypothetical protein
MQVASRIWCLWGIVVPCAATVIPHGLLTPAQQAALGLPAWANINFITLMTAWACSEVIRYGFFALKEALGQPPYFATWLRCACCADAVCLRLLRGVDVNGYGFFALKKALGQPPYFATWLRCAEIEGSGVTALLCCC